MDISKSTDNLITWRIYYANGSTFSSEDGAPEHAPGIGVLIIVQLHPRHMQGERPVVAHTTDYYIWLGNSWLGCDLFRVWQYLLVDNQDCNFPRAVLGGETIDSVLYRDTVRRAKKDPDFFR